MLIDQSILQKAAHGKRKEKRRKETTQRLLSSGAIIWKHVKKGVSLHGRGKRARRGRHHPSETV